MKALTYQGMKKVKVKEVEDAKLKNADDVLVRITTTAICGSDLHLYNGEIPNMPDDFIIGHEPMGIVEEVGKDVTRVKKGDRVIVPFNVACGKCWYCSHQLESQCDNSNEFLHGDTGGYLGYSDTFGGYAGGQAELLHVPYGNFMPFKVPEDAEMEDEKLLFLSDILPTAYWSVENAGVKQGDTVIILGCGPVGLLAQKFAWLKGAKRVIAVDHVDYRLEHARKTNNVEAFDFKTTDNLLGHLQELTGGGADVVIDAVGLDAEKTILEKVETLLKLQGGGLGAFRMACKLVRKGGTIQVTGVYGMNYNAFPFGDLFARNITVKLGQAPVIHYMPELYRQIKEGVFDPTDIISHRISLDEAERGYRIFNDKEEGAMKIILKP
ncbi:zinc-dependent alcohol dehydrogenase [Paenibacillus sacheonensis]|uniref:Alcohol dehydrogenase catalytic domain-containing protein n=1 Tax=Paenibacillus sacheonensis TaxID=742054 RepID=A0A7X4YQ00_9BACL|nr:zinc-dependent alcohol dehydrogenase [Paenibacillus sacheonensis]MBM7566225.1 S-(hydroxymethyl)glutathione dehydrogenase/alcohol dehydrogenase [Paenibacillus sacheonensis]NBC70432.1 alcohol dehydrogenase catalytic domain-containing protein [Paenibacillus sacheonensis]